MLELQRRVEEARAEQNKLSKRIQEAGKDKAQRDALIAEGKLLAEQIKAMEPFLRESEETCQQLLYLVPNIPDPSAPIGKDENDNVPIRYWGEKASFDFQPLDHYTLMQKLDVVDIERAVRIAGARSYALKGDAARLELALMNFAMDCIARKGFTPVTVQAMARDFAFIGSGQFPRGRDQVYAIEGEDTFLVGTAEVPITGMYKDEMLRYEDLPLTFVGYCPCFRKEAGTYGKDTRGVFRVHQFNKVEQYVISKADHEDSVRWHEQLIRNVEALVQALELPYRVNIRYRDEDGKLKFVYTLNNTALVSPRILLPCSKFTSSPMAACSSRHPCAPIWEDRSTSGRLRKQGRAIIAPSSPTHPGTMEGRKFV